MTASPTASPTAPSSTAPLRIPRFRVLWAASTVSNIGSFLQSVAASWLMLELTGSATWVGLMVASSTLPLLLLALPAGALADLFDRRRILIASQVLMAAAALAMTVLQATGATTPPRLLGLGLVLGVGVAFSLPAWQALVPDLVPRDLVAGAVALNSAAFNVARAIGPALGGLLVASVGPAWGFGLNTLSYFCVVAAVASFKGGSWHQDDETSVRSAIALGLRYARFTPSFRPVLAVASAFALSSASLQALLPNLTSEELGGDATTLGWLLGAMGCGALVGAFTRQRVAGRLGRALVPGGIAGFGVSGVLVGLSPGVVATALGMALAGVAWVWTLATLNATTQLLSPAWVRGRLMSLYTLAFVGFIPLGSILAGALGDAVGVRGAIIGMSASAVALGLVAAVLPLPVLGRFASPEAATDYEWAPHAATVGEGEVTVLSTWVVDEDDLDAFLDTMGEVRLIRLRTGAHRWQLHRNADDPHRITETMQLTSWEQHLRQHDRLDRAATEVLRRARAYDRAGGPVTHHLVAVDVVHPEQRPDWGRLLAIHDEHAADGERAADGQVDGRADGRDPDGPGDVDAEQVASRSAGGAGP